VSITPAGKRFQLRVAAVLALADTAKLEARSTDAGELGAIALGYTAMSMFSTALPNAIREFRQQYPHIALSLRELTSREQFKCLGERTLDLAVLRRVGVQPLPGIQIAEWYRTPLVAALPTGHAFTTRRSLSLIELKDDSFIMYPRDAGTGIFWQVLDLCAKAGFRPRIAREVLESSTMIGLVAAGAGVAIVPSDMTCIRFSGVEYRPIADAGAVSVLHLAQRKDDRNPHLLALGRALKGHARLRVRQRSRRERGLHEAS
jgi:DNA-binding transcriptional LysR family regulator